MADEQEKRVRPQRVRFMYQKARHHRTFHADGMWAGVTPKLEIQFALFNDLRPMPADVTHDVTEQGTLGEEVGRTEENCIVREVDATVVMAKDTAKLAIELLQRMVLEIEAHEQQTQVNFAREHQSGEAPQVS